MYSVSGVHNIGPNAQYQAYIGESHQRIRKEQFVIASSAKVQHGRKARVNQMKLMRSNNHRQHQNAVQHVLTSGTTSQRQHHAYAMPVDQTSAMPGQTRRNTRRTNNASMKQKNTTARSKTFKPSIADPLPQNVQQNYGKVQGQTQSNSQLTVLGGNLVSNTKNVDLLVIGSGPASLGLVVSAVKNSRFGELIQDDGLAILDSGISFGGGNLCNYGINSNTSANSFLKCIFRKIKKDKQQNQQQQLMAATYLGNILIQNTKTELQKELQKQPAAVLSKIEASDLVKETKQNNCKRRQKSFAKERSNQNQLNGEMKTSQNLQRSLEPSHRFFKMFTGNRKTDPHVEGIVAADDKLHEKKDEIVINAQPQDPDMLVEEQPEADSSAQLENVTLNNGVPKVQIEAQAADQLIVKSTKVEPITVERTKQKRINRRKSREGSEFTGRTAGVRKIGQLSANRTHSMTTNIRGNQAMKRDAFIVYTQGAIPMTSQQTHKQLAKAKEDQQNDYLPNKEEKQFQIAENVLTPFKEIFSSNIAIFFRQMAKNIAPLSLVGHLLNYVGNHLLHYAYKTTGRRIYMPMHKALSIHLMGNGEIMTQVLKTEFTIMADPQKNSQNFKVIEGQQSVVYFRSKAVVIAGGATQGTDSRTLQWFPNLNLERMIASDSFLKKKLFIHWIATLRQRQRPRVVIIGGSHSGFSCAWMLLKGPSLFSSYKFLDNEDQKSLGHCSPKASKRMPQASRKSIKNCTECCSCGIAIQIANKKATSGIQIYGGPNASQSRYQDEHRSQSKNGPRGHRIGGHQIISGRELSPVNKNFRLISKTIKQKKDMTNLKPVLPNTDSLFNKMIKSPEPKQVNNPAMNSDLNLVQYQQESQPQLTCTCICKCFGYFKYDEWSGDEPLSLPKFSAGDIKILYRDRIKVFFKTAKDAVNAGYTDFDPEERAKKKKDGYIYSFTGLRGDAKKLYLDVKSGLETRVSFIKAETPEKQRVFVEKADLVIWACGYQTNSVKIFDVSKKELELSQKVPGTQFDVDGKNRVMLADGNVLNKVFACGVGFPVRTKDGGLGNQDPSKNPRADSFSLYMHTVGEVLLKSLLPRKKLTTLGCAHKEAANPYLKAATYEQIMKVKKHKNKKPQLQHLSTKKDQQVVNSKLGYLMNPVGRLATNEIKAINISVDHTIDPLQRKMTNVYNTYLENNNRSKQSKQNPETVLMNKDLQDQNSFGVMASKSNCFSYRQNYEEFDETTKMIHTGCSDILKGNEKQAKQDLYSNECEVEEPTHRVVKFPQIHRESSLIQARELKNTEAGKLQDIIHARSISSLAANVAQIPQLDDQGIQYFDEPSMALQTFQQNTHEVSNEDHIHCPQDHSISLQHTPKSQQQKTHSNNLSAQNKSPLLLYKKLQKMSQKQKDLPQTAGIQPQANQANSEQTVHAYYNQLKSQTTGKGLHKSSQKAHQQQQYHGVKVGIDLTKRMNNIYLAHHADIQKAADNETKKGGTQKRTAFLEKSSICIEHEQSSVLEPNYEKTHGKVYQPRIGKNHDKKAFGKNNMSSKDPMSDQIITTQKTFNDVEQNGSSRYKLYGLSNTGANGRPMNASMLRSDVVSAGLRKDKIPSIEAMPSTKNSNLNTSQNCTIQKIDIASLKLQDSTANLPQADKQTIDREDNGLVTATLMSSNNIKNAISVQKLHSNSNSELFPPIDIKNHQHQPQQVQPQQSSKAISDWKKNSSHRRKLSAKVWPDSKKSLTQSSQQVSAQQSHSDNISKPKKEQSLLLEQNSALLKEPQKQVYQKRVQQSNTKTADCQNSYQMLNPMQKPGCYLASNNNRCQNISKVHKSSNAVCQQQSNFSEAKSNMPSTNQNQLHTYNIVEVERHEGQSDHTNSARAVIQNKFIGSRNSQEQLSSSSSQNFQRKTIESQAMMLTVQPDDQNNDELPDFSADDDDSRIEDELNERVDGSESGHETIETNEDKEEHHYPETTYIKPAVDRFQPQTVKTQRKVINLFRKEEESRKSSTDIALAAANQKSDANFASPRIIQQKVDQKSKHEKMPLQPTKYESEINKKGSKTNEASQNAKLAACKAGTPCRPGTSKRYHENHQTQSKNPGGIYSKEAAKILGSRRHATTSATDIQQHHSTSSKHPYEKGKLSKQRNSTLKKTAAAHTAKVLEKSLNTGSEVDQPPTAQCQKSGNDQQPYLDTSLNTIELDSQQQQQAKKAPNERLQRHRESRQAILSQLSMRQRQVAEAQNTKQQAKDHKQGPSNTVRNAQAKAENRKNAQTPSKKLIQQLGERQVNERPQKSAKITKMLTVNNEEVTEKADKSGTTPFSTKQQHPSSSSKDICNNYNNVQKSGFFVNKTIRDLSIKPNLDFGEEMLHPAEENQMLTQINAIKKEVQQKAANLSPVLKSRCGSKLNVKTMHQHQHAKNSGKYRSPQRQQAKQQVQLSCQTNTEAMNTQQQAHTAIKNTEQVQKVSYINSTSAVSSAALSSKMRSPKAVTKR